MLRLWLRNAVIVLLFLIVASCSGGGCSGCSGCGTTPIPGGFPAQSAVKNAGAVRVTRPGLDFLEANVGTLAKKLTSSPTGVLEFQIPQSTQTAIGIDVTICNGGPKPTASPPKCVAQIKIGDAKLKIDAVSPSTVKVSGKIPVRLQDLPVHALVDFDVGLGNGACESGAPKFDFKDFDVLIELPLVKDTTAPRNDYTKVDVKNAKIDVAIAADDVAICKDCGFLTFGCDIIFGLIKNMAFSSLVGGVKDALKGQIENAFCTKPNPTQTPSCPDGSKPNNADPQKADKCVYKADPNTCMPTLLGTDGRMDLSSALASISPGTRGGLDFVIASGGAMEAAPGNPVNAQGHTTNGITLSLLGGALPQPQSTCVPVAANPLPQNILVPDELKGDTITPWPASTPGPHLGIALAGRFLDYAFTGVYNSGLLCLGVSTEQFPQINSGLLSLLAPSLKKLSMEQRPGAAAIATRPQAPPKVKLGGGTDVKKDPLLVLTLPKFSIDFYVWSVDRFVRAFTFTADVSVPVNLSTAKDPKTNPKGGLLPSLGDLTVQNPSVSNADLLLDNPDQLATGFGALLGSVVGQFLGSGFSPIDLSGSLSSLGLALDIPAGGIRKLSKGNDDYLGIFANLALAASPAMPEIDTQAQLLAKEVHAEGLVLVGADRSKFPKLKVALSSPQDDGTRPIEYAWWIDEGTRSAWTRERNVTIDQDALFLQGKHVLHVAARVAGHPESEDSSPKEIPFAIDVLPPNVRLEARDRSLTIHAWDYVSETATLKARWRFVDAKGDGAWTDWAPLEHSIELGDAREAARVDVEVKDEEENLGRVSQPLVRGRPDPSLAAAGGCNCTTAGGGGAAGLGWLATLGGIAGVLALLGRRRRERPKAARSSSRSKGAALALGAIGLLAATTEGCACGSEGEATPNGCGPSCSEACGPANAMGLIGAYTSAAKAKDGTIWVSGYNDADLNGGNNWGDLVVGRYDTAKQQVAWQTVDGVPARTDNTCPANDRSGWRGGETESGDNVGLWTSLQMSSDDRPLVAYYDVTNHALKFAARDGDGWAVHVVKAGGATSDAGRYAKLLLLNGNPVVGFLQMEKGNGGRVRSKVVLAKARTAVPTRTEDWSFEDVAVEENSPCRARYCDSGQVCVKATGICQPKVGGCTPSPCPAGSVGAPSQECVTIDGKAACSAVLGQDTIETYPEALGDYLSMAIGPSGLGMVVYDRVHGNLVGLFNAGGKWTQAILDGETGSRANKTAVDTGDVGVGASLAIASNGDWHVSYVNGFTESLQVLTVPGGTPPASPLKPEIVDNGSGLGGKAFTDGLHVVGDDSQIRVDASGTLTVTYQDATAGTLRVATGAPAQGGHTWSVKAVTLAGRFAGFFPQQVPGSGVLHWWRQTDRKAGEVHGDVALSSP